MTIIVIEVGPRLFWKGFEINGAFIITPLLVHAAQFASEETANSYANALETMYPDMKFQPRMIPIG